MISLPSLAAAAAVASVRLLSITHQLSLFLNHSSSSSSSSSGGGGFDNNNLVLLQTTSFGGQLQSGAAVGPTT